MEAAGGVAKNNHDIEDHNSSIRRLTKMSNQKLNRETCPLCGKDFATRAERDEHSKIVHSTMNRKTNLESQHSGGDIEPADNAPTTELPPGAEERVRQSRPQNPTAPKSSKRAAS
jgi:hypothetical protein